MPVWIYWVSTVFGTAAVLGAPLLIGLLIVQRTPPPRRAWRTVLRLFFFSLMSLPLVWAAAVLVLFLRARLQFGSWPRVEPVTPFRLGGPYYELTPVDPAYMPTVYASLGWLLVSSLLSIYVFWPLWVVSRRALAKPKAWATFYMACWCGVIAWLAFDPGGALEWCYHDWD